MRKRKIRDIKGKKKKVLWKVLILFLQYSENVMNIPHCVSKTTLLVGKKKNPLAFTLIISNIQAKHNSRESIALESRYQKSFGTVRQNCHTVCFMVQTVYIILTFCLSQIPGLTGRESAQG